MPSFGTKKFWKPSVGASLTEMENQVLKNSGYFNIQLFSVSYFSKGNFWQNTFGGTNKIVLSTSLKYQTGVESIEATTIQDMREVRVNKNHNLGLQRNLAIKIPAITDAISIEVKMTAIENDSLQSKFDLLNHADYQSPLQLAPAIVGQVLTITSLAKKLFSNTNPVSQLEASYAGIISLDKVKNPIKDGKLTGGLLIMISSNEGTNFDNVDETKFELRGDTLFYNENLVENTYVIFNITFEKYKGEDQKSNWFRKYSEAMSNLERILLPQNKNEITKIYSDSLTLWIEGNALLDADITYINDERVKLKTTALKFLNEKYKYITTSTSPEAFEVAAISDQILTGISGKFAIANIKDNLPSTANYIKDNYKLDFGNLENVESYLKIYIESEKALDLLKTDGDEYLKELKSLNLDFNL